ncbi:hypothetical protein [Stenotrophomonas chelatiphaga]|uniref:hypothetical protein n=2 Tax=Stenotrophomonas TaxID=40323 RepID=UPI00285E08B6|nr:hypothetical protein [Stenotrophomonas chelatiphaga]MDR6095493.1 hypothetical protein [Stenotrophomonas sp. SORGH_AS_0321]
MTHHMSHEEYVIDVRRQAVALCSGILDGTINVIAGCHSLHSLRWEVDVEQHDEDFFLFAMISSEIETLPTGAEGDQWAAAALAEREPEIQKAIEWALPQAVVACRSVVQRFGPDGSGSGSA